MVDLGEPVVVLQARETTLPIRSILRSQPAALLPATCMLHLRFPYYSFSPRGLHLNRVNAF